MRRTERATSAMLLVLAAGCGRGDGGLAPADSGLVVVSSIAVPSNYGVHDQFVRDGIAFVCTWNSGLRIYDVGGGAHGGSPANPVLMGTVVTGANGVSAGAAAHNAWWYHAPGGQKRYVFVGQEGPGSIGGSSSGDIHVVDVSDFTQPVEVAYYHMSGLGAPVDSAGTHNFWVDETNEILYAAYYNGGVVAINIAGTLSGNLGARQLARFQPGGSGNTYVWGVQLHNGSLYAADMLSGLWQLRLNGSAFQVLAGGNNVADRFTSDLWVTNGFAYTGTWGGFPRNGLSGNVVKVWQLGTAGAPVLVDSLKVASVQTTSDIEVSTDGRLLMVTTEGGARAGVHFFDLTVSRSSPPEIASHLVGEGFHTGTFAQIGGRRYAFLAKNPPNPAVVVLDVTGIIP